MRTEGESVNISHGGDWMLSLGEYCSLIAIRELAKCEKWKEFSARVQGSRLLISEAFKLYYKDMPEKYRRDFVVNCYDHVGDRIPGCRAALRRLPKNGINELPEEYRTREYITVYRAGEEPIEKAKYRISWTLNKDTAEFFLNEYRGKHARVMYMGKIRPKDVIAYDDLREEQEVMQYGKVFDVQEVKKADIVMNLDPDSILIHDTELL